MHRQTQTPGGLLLRPSRFSGNRRAHYDVNDNEVDSAPTGPVVLWPKIVSKLTFVACHVNLLFPRLHHICLYTAVQEFLHIVVLSVERYIKHRGSYFNLGHCTVYFTQSHIGKL